MTLPVTYQAVIETQALTFAHETIAHFQSGDFCNLGCPITHPDAGRRLLRRMINHYAMSSAPAMLTAAELASQWDEADIALRELILEFNNRHEPLPAFLATHNAKILAGYVSPRPRGRKKASNLPARFLSRLLDRRADGEIRSQAEAQPARQETARLSLQHRRNCRCANRIASGRRGRDAEKTMTASSRLSAGSTCRGLYEINPPKRFAPRTAKVGLVKRPVQSESGFRNGAGLRDD